MPSPIRVQPWVVAVAATAVVFTMAPGRAASTPSRPTTDVGGTIAPGTVWSAAGSPYRTISNIEVPAGVTLVIEAGVEVRMGDSDRIDVAGAVKANGSAAAPITVTADDSAAPWNGIILEATAGPSEFSHVRFSGNGARPAAMLEVRTSDVLVSECVFEDAGGVGLDITAASPRVERSVFRNAGVASAMPPGALRIRGESDPVIVDNLFQSNENAPVFLDANASPTLAGNRFEFNGWNGVRLAGSVRRPVTLPSLGPRRWSYWVDPNGITVRDTGTFTVSPGTTLEFISNGMRVEGTLRVMGAAGAEVVMTTASLNPAPGRWRDIEFAASSTGFDPETGQGSVIQHAVIEYGGSVDTGAIRVSAASPRIANTVIRHSGNRGITITGNGARPILVGNLFLGLDSDPNGVGVYTAAGAEPRVSFSIFQDNRTGIETDAGAKPVIGPLNRFDRNLGFGVLNRDDSLCVAAEGNDWTDPAGPFDPSPRDDSCGLGDNPGAGDVVSDNVDYQPWAGVVDRPLIVSPRCGTQRSAAPLVEGWAPPESRVTIYDNFEPLGETTAEAGAEALTAFSFQAPRLAPGSHVLVARAEAG
ncbi:MAG: right-handed parallel beta-helix repeat-containing protein, partial [Anaerolineae bacterium]